MTKVDQAAIRKRVTDAMIEALTKNQPPWRQPWNGGSNFSSSPCNFLSKRHYRGINPLLLLVSSMAKGYTSPYWGTADAWAKHKSAIVRSGQDPTYVIFYTMVPSKKKNSKGEDILIPIMREYALYNAEQMIAPPKKLDKLIPTLVTNDVGPNFEPAEELIGATGANIVYSGSRAAYDHDGDHIVCPERSTFDSIADFYETVFHELAHWSRNPKRLGQKKRDYSYAYEELVAEIAACMTLMEISVPMGEQTLDSSQSYVKGWIERMGNDPKFIFDAASDASKVVDYLLAFRTPVEEKYKCVV